MKFSCTKGSNISYIPYKQESSELIMGMVVSIGSNESHDHCWYESKNGLAVNN